MSSREGRVFVISSPSGGGKTTAIRLLRRRLRGLGRSISVTTREPRPGERRGLDYGFITRREFLELRRRRALLEWARVHGAYYGTPREPVEAALRAGRDIILCIDVQGARKVRRLLGRKAVLLFLTPPSLEQLQERLERRSTDAPESIRTRLSAAKKELACAAWYDHRVINNRLGEAVSRLATIIRSYRRADQNGPQGGVPEEGG